MSLDEFNKLADSANTESLRVMTDIARRGVLTDEDRAEMKRLRERSDMLRELQQLIYIRAREENATAALIGADFFLSGRDKKRDLQ